MTIQNDNPHSIGITTLKCKCQIKNEHHRIIIMLHNAILAILKRKKTIKLKGKDKSFINFRYYTGQEEKKHLVYG